MQLVYRGSVNRWECDENDHLNVRFYVEKHWQALCGWLAMVELAVPLTSTELQRALQVHHLRFLKESRLAAPLSGFAAVIATPDPLQDELRVLTELRHSFTGEVLCTCVHQLRGLEAAFGSGALSRMAGSNALPDYAAPRGLEDLDLTHASLGMSAAFEHNFQTIGMGVLQPVECGADGAALPHTYMGRISDSMPHLWAALDHDGIDEGGAVLEYRLRYHHALKSSQRFTVVSGIEAVQPKVQRFAHLLFDTDSETVCVSAQAAAVRMDLNSRRAVTLSQSGRRV